MIRHQWNNDVCQRCGLSRTLRIEKKWQRTLTVVRYGVDEDKHLFTENLRYYYGEPHGFKRPDCTRTKPAGS